MLLNTDGISFSESSNLSIWPIFLVINEIEPEKKTSNCFENIVIAGKVLVFLSWSLQILKIYKIKEIETQAVIIII